MKLVQVETIAMPLDMESLKPQCWSLRYTDEVREMASMLYRSHSKGEAVREIAMVNYLVYGPNMDDPLAVQAETLSYFDGDQNWDILEKFYASAKTAPTYTSAALMIWRDSILTVMYFLPETP